MNQAGFRVPEVLDLAKISSRQLEYWTANGGVGPSVAEGRGSGSRRLYSFDDVVVLATIGRLLAGGLTLQAAKHAAQELRGWPPEEMRSAALMIRNDQPAVVAVGAVAGLVGRATQVIVIVPLAPIIDDIARGIATLHTPRLTVPALLTAGQTAARLRVSPTTVVRWTVSGKLPAADPTPGGHRRYHSGAINHFLARSPQPAPSRAKPEIRAAESTP